MGTRWVRSTRVAKSPCGSPTRRGWDGSCTLPPRTSIGARTRNTRRGCGAWHVAELERIVPAGGGGPAIAAFIAQLVGGATLGAAVPSDDYWPTVVELCRANGILVIADEVMTGFGRTGRWFGVDHWGVRPDILTAGKGATSGYVPFGFAAASGAVFEVVASAGFVHGFTWSHNALGASVGRAVLRRLADDGLIERSAALGVEFASHCARSSATCRSSETSAAWV